MMKKLTVEANIDNFDRVLDFVNAELELHGFPPELIPDVDVAVEEVFINISTYAYHPRSGDVTLHISVGEEATIIFVDEGIPFNPLEVAPPDLDKPLMDREIGGLGILFVRQIMDDVAYSYSGGENILTMKKRGCVS